MKFVSLTAILLASSLQVIQVQGDELANYCAEKTSKDSCLYVHGCSWEKLSKNTYHCHHTHDPVPCGQRTDQQCEDDDSCLFTNNKGTKTCVEMNRGHGLENEPCSSMLIQDDDGDYYREVEDEGCAVGFICQINDSNTTAYDTPISGLCKPTTCYGKKIPGNCNGNRDEAKDQCQAETERVTICHRTCSRKNPWVRITIDEDAWSGEGCGHSLQHDIRDECQKYGPDWTAWAPDKVGYTDYLLRYHGTREAAKATFGLNNKAAEKAYWRQWEPACPYVRNGFCCSYEEGTCCGAPVTLPPPTLAPVAEVTAAPTKCPIDMGLTDETICPGYDAVGLMGIQTSTGQIVPQGLDPTSLVYQMDFGGTPEAREVTFKLDNPFEGPVDMMIQYHKHPETSTNGALDPDCITKVMEPGCNPDATAITAGCIHPPNGMTPFTIVSFFIFDETFGSTAASPYECCPIPEQDFGVPLIESTFKILCECPTDSTSGRQLLRSSSATPASTEDLQLWQATVGTGH